MATYQLHIKIIMGILQEVVRPKLAARKQLLPIKTVMATLPVQVVQEYKGHPQQLPIRTGMVIQQVQALAGSEAIIIEVLL